jgi:hypothetical protein
VAADLDLLKDETADLALQVHALDEWIHHLEDRGPGTSGCGADDQPPASSNPSSPKTRPSVRRATALLAWLRMRRVRPNQ